MSDDNQRNADKARDIHIHEQALRELKRDIGIDFRKLLRGDERETQKWKMKLWQDSMKIEQLNINNNGTVLLNRDNPYHVAWYEDGDS